MMAMHTPLCRIVSARSRLYPPHQRCKHPATIDTVAAASAVSVTGRTRALHSTPLLELLLLM